MTENVNELLTLLIVVHSISARSYEISDRSAKISRHWQVSYGNSFDMPACVI